MAPDEEDVIDLTGDDDDDDVICFPPPPSSRSSGGGAGRARKRIKSEDGGAMASSTSASETDEDSVEELLDRKPAAKTFLDSDSDDEIQILEAVSSEDDVSSMEPCAAAAKASSSNDDEEDVKVVGTKNHIRLPHMRQHCTEYPFQNDAKLLHCPECYCYVCDVAVAECTSWSSHCRATNDGPQVGYWNRLRQQAKDRQSKPKPPVGAAVFTDGELPTGYHYGYDCSHKRYLVVQMCEMCFCYVCSVPASQCSNWSHPKNFVPGCNHHNAGPGRTLWERLRTRRRLNTQIDLEGDGPWPANDAVDKEEWGVVQCRHCSYLFRSPFRHGPTSCSHWCGACGRVGAESYLNKSSGYPFPDKAVKAQRYTFLGTRTFSFRLRAHDPRKMNEFAKYWKENEGSAGWNYCEKEMEQELFDHRFGSHPTLKMLIASTPIVDEDQIPIDGSRIVTRDLPSSSSPCLTGAADTEAILWDRQAVTLCQAIRETSPSFGNRESRSADVFDELDGDISATWNKEERQGTVSIRVFLKVATTPLGVPLVTTLFLGCWYGAFPFELTDLCGSLVPSADTVNGTEIRDPSNAVSVPCRSAKYSDVEKHKDRFEGAIQSLAEQVDSKVSSHSLTASISYIFGGVCPCAVDFKSVLQKYFCEAFSDLVPGGAYDSDNFLKSWLFQELGFKYRHRNMPRSDSAGTERALVVAEVDSYRCLGSRMSLQCCLSPEDFLLATSFADSCRSLREQVTSLASMMHHLESRGHAEAPFVDGLTVDLLPFQKQSLQWAVERETIEGGTQRFFWAKLPQLEDSAVDELYYCPLLGKFSSQKPSLVRGGILAEMMGLGKTLISLALVLANPAPLLPEPGGSSSDIPKTPDRALAFRDPDLFEKTSKVIKQRGSIVSSGTLVVCNVSLVGQWIEEAKSKLKNPGAVYSYHGQGRKRDPHVLAKHSIVVTTYETLSSDATYHRKKSDSGDYCPPCEQVRWWRIICDECHVLRYGNSAKSDAVMALVADNKWLVSGTPINTSLMDLENQFRFLGLDHVPQLIGDIRDSTCERLRDKAHRKSRHTTSCAPVGHFTFLMRGLMMRHAHEQKYTGTSTTLMSLPPKSERALCVTFSDAERAEYEKLEATALSFYTNFRMGHRHELQKHYLKLLRHLIPLRVACAGGPVPLVEDEGEGEGKKGTPKHKTRGGDTDEDDCDEDDEDVEQIPKAKKQRKPQVYSEFAFTSKLELLIQELQRIRDEDPTAKSLVFSQFNSTLTWLQEELPRHGFEFRTLSGKMSMAQRRKALHDFQQDPPTTIFLLSMRAGAVGINLTQANRVFLMEPSMNPALEAQAVGRVHRLGQTRPVEVVRLLVDDSIETRLRAVLRRQFGGTAAAAAAKETDVDQGAATQDKASEGATQDKTGTSEKDVDDDDDDSDDDDSDDDDKAVDKSPKVSDKKPNVTNVDMAAAASAAAPALLGSIQTDKSVVAAEDFDQLYGYEDFHSANEGDDEDDDERL